MAGVIVVLLIALIFMILEIKRETSTFKVVHYDVQHPKLNQLKKETTIVFLSDLHNNCYGKDNDVLLAAIKKEKPDVILVSGDILIGQEGQPFEVGTAFMEKLPSICPVFYANGNHEQRMKENPEEYGETYRVFKERLQKAGVRTLENETIRYNDGNFCADISGLEIPLSCYKRFHQPTLGKEYLEEKLGQADSKIYQILIAHNPMYFPDYKAWGACLTLSGHLHGGVVRIPGIGGIITPQIRLIPKYSGELTKEKDASIVVSKGLGTHTINIRLFNHAEVVVLHLGREKKR